MEEILYLNNLAVGCEQTTITNVVCPKQLSRYKEREKNKTKQKSGMPIHHDHAAFSSLTNR